MRRVLRFAALVLCAALLLAPAQAAQTRPTAGFAQLYDGALGSAPAAQGMVLATQPPIGAQATQTVAGGGVVLDTTPAMAELAGYIARPERVPPLERAAGYSVFVTVRLLEERHTATDRNGDGIADRAGFSLTVLGSDARGVELGFWQGEIWAQADDRGGPGELFTHAESAAYDTTAAARTYELRVQGDGYTLLAGGAPLLGGPLRDYSAFSGPVDPYDTPNFIFVGDNSGNGSARVRLEAVWVVAGPEQRVALPLVTGCRHCPSVVAESSACCSLGRSLSEATRAAAAGLC